MIKPKMMKAFSKASKTYDKAGFVQQEVACLLAERLKDIAPQAGKGLEIGCGTGFLTERLLANFHSMKWIITDLSSEMVETCQNKFDHHIDFQIMDGENPSLDNRFDLIVSNLAFQWFYDLDTCLKNFKNMMNAKGILYFTTLGNGSFKEWKDNLSMMDLNHGMHDYPDIEVLKKLGLDVEVIELKYTFASVQDFLNSIKQIGAHTPKNGHEPLSAGALRKAIKAFDEKGEMNITYEIYLCQMSVE